MPTRWLWVVVLAVLSLMAAACSGDSAELDEVKAERDALAAELAASASRHDLSLTNQQLVAEIIADPDENGLVTYSLVDWPYPGPTVRAAVATGGPG